MRRKEILKRSIDKRNILERYIKEIKKRKEFKNKKESYCSATEDALHLLNHNKHLCRICYSYKNKKDIAFASPFCKLCSKRIITISKRFNINTNMAKDVLQSCFEYKVQNRIEILKKGIEESKEVCPYNMVNARIIEVSNNDIIADYNSVNINYSFSELEALKRVKQRRLSKEYNRMSKEKIPLNERLADV